MGMGIYRPRWQDTEAFFTYQSSEQHNLLTDTMPRCDILRYINFVEISCSFREDPSLEFTNYAVKLYRRSNAKMFSLTNRHFQFFKIFEKC